MKPLVAITLSNHWSIKNLIHSGFSAQLQQYCRLQFWTQSSRFEALYELFKQLGIDAELCELPVYQEPKPVQFWRLVQKSLLYERHRLSTERIQQKSHRGRRGRGAKLLAPIGRIIARSPFGEYLLYHAAKKRAQLTPIDLIQFGKRPDLLLIGNPFDFREDPLSATAHANGIPVFTMIPSWDNLTSKGVLDTRYSKICVWNDGMKDELLRLYPQINPANIEITGLLRMDAFEDAYSPTGEWAEGEKPLILYANTATKSIPQQPQIIHHLVSALADGEFGDASLLIRCHPHDDAALYAGFDNPPTVRVWPKAEEATAAFGVEAAPPASDLKTLAEMILSASVVINAASTIALDAAYCDKPIVSVAYDGDETPCYEDSILSAYDYEHQKPYLASGAGELCRSRRELIDAVKGALLHPELRRKERHKLAKLISPGNAVNLMVSVVLESLEIRQLQEAET